MPSRVSRLTVTNMVLAALLFLAACGHEGVGLSTSATPERTGGTGKLALLIPYGDENRSELINLASSLENGARLALSDLDADGIELTVYETKGSVSGATSAARRALAEGADVIIGPVFKDSSRAVAEIAAEQGVSVFSFSNDASIVGGNLYVLGHTFENSAERIIEHATRRGKRNILSVHALNEQGHSGQLAILNALERGGSVLSGNVSYEFSLQGVVDAVPEIAAATDETQADLLIFTADTAGALSMLGQLLPESGVDTQRVQFSGLTRWDIPASNLENRGLQGGWFPMPDPNLSASFAYRYRYVYNEPPHPIAGLAYDAVLVANSVLRSGGRPDPRELQAAEGFFGATGLFRFTGTGRIQRALAIAEVKNNRAEVISPAPRSFADGAL
ncbi:MAG: penicillin-binding protein activator [Rhodobacteraceae bacterium]|nr:penicillin-binding protein activator [Paracoccaceae bacterium]